MRNRNRTSAAVAAGGLVMFLIVALFLHSLISSSPSRQPFAPRASSSSGKRHAFRRKKDKHRIAIVIPFYGENSESIPSYLNLFLTAAAGSASLVDFLIVHNGVLRAYTQPLPSNVKFIDMKTTKDFLELLMRVVDRRPNKLAVESKERLLQILTMHIHQYPYVLVEFKPATGHIFADLLKEYSHWGYADLDIAFGDLPRWITPDELTDYDIVTYGYGDQDRVYLRGQFTFHKNTDKVNQLWRDCEYLSSMDVRFAQVMSGKKKLRVESAEGCYSAAILKQKDIKVKYAVKAFTDVNAKDVINTHGLYMGIGAHKDRSVIYKAGNDTKALLQLPPDWFEQAEYAYGSTPLQSQVGTRVLVPTNRSPEKKKCMYWVAESYQKDICISGVQSNETLYWIDGKLYKQPFENVQLPGNIISRPFFHFQEWKRYYRSAQLATVHSSSEALGWVLAKEGAIPLFSRNTHGRKWGKTPLVSPLGVPMAQWKAIDNDNRFLLPRARYCLRSAPRKFPPQPVVAECLESLSWHDGHQVEILYGAPVWKHIDVKREVTLALTLQVTPKQATDTKALNGLLDILMANIGAWQGQPCVVVVHLAGASPDSISHVRKRFAALETDATLVALISQEHMELVSRKALLNMATDAAPTRWVLSGVEIERGLVLSKEASSLAYRSSKIHSDTTGTVLAIPQFAIKDDRDRRMELSFHDLAKMRGTGKPAVYGSDYYDEPCTDREKEPNTVMRPVHKQWWQRSLQQTASEYFPNNDASFHQLALALDDMQLAFTRLLEPDNEVQVYSLGSPILMTDSIGPHSGMKTFELAREIEEFGGKECFDGLRLAQLAALGYSIDVFPVAFAISTSGSRDAASHVVEDTHGSSPCHGCFMFDKEHSSIIKDIAVDERSRPAKAAILWDDMKKSRPFSQ